MKKIILVIVTILFFLKVSSCKDQVTEPTKIKSPLEMTWTVDTLSYLDSPQTLMSSIYGTAPNDIWITGHNAAVYGNLWHFDGLKWSSKIPLIRTANYDYYFNEIKGLSANNIWLTGGRRYYDITNPNYHLEKASILNYNGINWKEYQLKDSIRAIGVFCNSPNDIWTCGDNGYLFHYNGVDWKTEIIKLKNRSYSVYFLNSVAVVNNTVYLLAWVADLSNNLRHYIIKGSEGNWNYADSLILNYSAQRNFGDTGLYVGPSNKLYSYGIGGIWEYQNNDWVKLLDFYSRINELYELSDRYKIAVGDFGNVLFYDGNKWTSLENIRVLSSNISCRAVWTNGLEVFVIGYTAGAWPQKTIIWHGK